MARIAGRATADQNKRTSGAGDAWRPIKTITNIPNLFYRCEIRHEV
jgi:hypothetical protein